MSGVGAPSPRALKYSAMSAAAGAGVGGGGIRRSGSRRPSTAEDLARATVDPSSFRVRPGTPNLLGREIESAADVEQAYAAVAAAQVGGRVLLRGCLRSLLNLVSHAQHRLAGPSSALREKHFLIRLGHPCRRVPQIRLRTIVEGARRVIHMRQALTCWCFKTTQARSMQMGPQHRSSIGGSALVLKRFGASSCCIVRLMTP